MKARLQEDSKSCFANAFSVIFIIPSFPIQGIKIFKNYWEQLNVKSIPNLHFFDGVTSICQNQLFFFLDVALTNICVIFQEIMYKNI